MTGERPIVVAADETVLDEILRVAAVAGCEFDRAPDLTAARAHWARAPLVVLDEEAARLRPSCPGGPASCWSARAARGHGRGSTRSASASSA